MPNSESEKIFCSSKHPSPTALSIKPSIMDLVDMLSLPVTRWTRQSPRPNTWCYFSTRYSTALFMLALLFAVLDGGNEASYVLRTENFFVVVGSLASTFVSSLSWVRVRWSTESNFSWSALANFILIINGQANFFGRHLVMWCCDCCGVPVVFERSDVLSM